MRSTFSTPSSPLRAATSLITPIEPAAPRRPPALARQGQQSVQRTAFRRIEVAALSSCGSLHDDNEDAHSALDAAAPLFVVADGVGGGAMAQLASRQLVAHLHAALAGLPPDAEGVRRAMLAADRAIAERIAELTPAPGAATVALCAPVNLRATKWLVAWVGDCRVYRFAADEKPAIELLSRDDSFRELGELPPAGGSLDDPARMVGNGATTGANVALHELAAGELLVLCSDGVHKHLDDAGWRLALLQPVPLVERCADVIARARAAGSSDDATVLLIRCDAFALPRPSWLARRADSRTQPRTPR